jgi:multidrug resistance efflux pump
MIVVMLMVYLACVYTAFKVIKIEVKPFTVAVAVMVCVFMLGGIVTVWKLASPMSGQMTLRRHVVQITPDVREFVTKVFVDSNDLVEKGQPIFEVSKERFQEEYDQASATLAAAKLVVLQSESNVTKAEATIRKVDADTAIAKVQIDTAKKTARSAAGAVAKLKIAEAEAAYNAAQANSRSARASLRQAQSTLASNINEVEGSKLAVHKAEFTLSQTTYRSSVDGRVMNFQIREGTPVARWQFTTVGTIMDMSDTAILVVYPQNLLKYVNSGDSVEIAFRGNPGTIVTGKVLTVVKYTGEGQFAASGIMPVVATVGSKGFLVARIRLDDEELAKKLPLGADGTAAIYTGFGKPFHLISKIALRIKGYLYFLPV